MRAALDNEDVVATYHRTPIPGGIALDLTDAVAVADVVREAQPDRIVLAAAEAWVDRCEREPGPTRVINVDGTRAVARAAEAAGALLVVFSSEYVFDGRSGPYGEDVPLAPINEYGRQKAEVELIARALPHLICRTTGVFGWERAGKNFVCQLLARLRSGQPFDVPSDQVITPTYAPDLARAVVDLVRGRHTGTFNVVGPRTMQRTEVAFAAADAFDLPRELIRSRPTREIGSVARRPVHGGLRDDKLRATLGLPLSHLERALADMRRTAPAAV